MSPREHLNAALGPNAKGSEKIAWLEENGLALWDEQNDYVFSSVYNDTTTKGNVRTTGALVIPGKETLKRHPKTAAYGLHFRKTFTKDSGPLQPSRGETPIIEEARTLRAKSLLPTQLADHLEPLGASEFIYRSRVIVGHTFANLSPFPDIRKVLTTVVPEPKKVITRLREAYDTIEALHRYGVSQGDLNFENMLWLELPSRFSEYPARPIDFGGAEFKADLSLEGWDEQRADDFSEFIREAGLLQVNLGYRIAGKPFEEAIRLAKTYFDGPIAKRLINLDGEPPEI